MASIVWNGDAVFERVKAATLLGVDRTLAESSDHAKREHEWVSKTGFLEASIGILAPAHSEGLRVSGSFGALANYALFVEVGTSRIGITAVERTVGSEGWWTIPGPKPAPGVSVRQSFTIIPPGGGFGFRTVRRPSTKTGPLMMARSFLRAASYFQFPLLPYRIAAAFRGEEMI